MKAEILTQTEVQNNGFSKNKGKQHDNYKKNRRFSELCCDWSFITYKKLIGRQIYKA